MSAGLDIYRIERRTTQAVLVAAVWVVRAVVLTRYRAGDARRRLARRTR